MIQANLQQASFKGATFYWRTLTTNLGKKSVTHNYPGTDRRFVEDMGALPRTFTIEASIFGKIGTDEYFQKKQALENALSSKEPGYLVHPTYGRVYVTAKPATCSESQKELGEARYSLTFEKSDSVARPVNTVSTARQIEIKRQEAINNTIATAVAAWVSPESAGVATKVADNISDLGSQIDSVLNKVYAAKVTASQTLAQINAIKNEAVDYVNVPLGLFNSLAGVYEGLMTIDDNYESQFERLTTFFGGDPDAGPGQTEAGGQVIKAISYETAAAENNRVVQNEASNLMAFINASSTISKIDFQSTTDLENYAYRIESQFEIIVQSSLMASAMRDSVLDLRSLVIAVVEDKKLLTQTIISADFKVDMPLNVALFMYTGSLENEDYILSLNSSQDIVFSTGTVELLQ